MAIDEASCVLDAVMARAQALLEESAGRGRRAAAALPFAHRPSHHLPFALPVARYLSLAASRQPSRQPSRQLPPGRYLVGAYSDADTVLAPILCRLAHAFPWALTRYATRHALLAPYLERLRATPACVQGSFVVQGSLPSVLPWLLGFSVRKCCGCTRPPGA